MLVLTVGNQQCIEINIDGEIIVLSIVKIDEKKVKIGFFADKKKTIFSVVKNNLSFYWNREKFSNVNNSTGPDEKLRVASKEREHAGSGDSKLS